MVSETGVKIFVGLLLFWTILLGFTYYFSPVIVLDSNADLSYLHNGNSLDNFDSLFRVMTFKVEGDFPIFIGLLFDFITLMSLIMAFVVLLK